jgi:hypothetical protein
MGVRRRNTFAAVATGLPQALADARAETTQQVKDVEQQLVAKDTESLHDTIRDDLSTTRGAGSDVSHVLAGDPSTIGEHGRPVDYVAYVEADQPFVAPARKAISHKKNVQKHVRALIKRSR